MSDVDLLVLEQGAVGLVNGLGGIILSLKVHKSTANATATCVMHNLDGENVPEDAEGIVEGLVVDGLVQTLDEDIANTGAMNREERLVKHDTYLNAVWYIINSTKIKILQIHNPINLCETAYRRAEGSRWHHMMRQLLLWMGS
jgi:hypothetical protein